MSEKMGVGLRWVAHASDFSPARCEQIAHRLEVEIMDVCGFRELGLVSHIQCASESKETTQFKRAEY